MDRLIIIDGNAILHRAFHSMPPLTNAKGQLTNAVYGFVAILLKVVRELSPAYLIVCFDKKAPTFRKKIYKDYQAKRPEMDKDLIPQIDLVHDVVGAMKIPVFEKDGFEADDVIATLVKQSQTLNSKLKTLKKSQIQNIDEVIIVTGDRDLLQLVDDRVKLFMPVKGLSEGKLFGEKETIERMGVAPKLIPDFKALAGDNSDNYPGVNGIGPKTAVNLINQFGSIANIYKKIDEVKNLNVKEKLIKDKKNAFMSHELATVITDVPIKINIDKSKIHDLATKETIQVFGNLGFKTLLKRLLNMGMHQTVHPIKNQTSGNPEKLKEEKKQMELF